MSKHSYPQLKPLTRMCVCVYVRLRLRVMVGEGDIGMMSIIMTIKKWSLLQAAKLSTCTCAFVTVTRCLIYSVKGESFCHSFLLSCVRHLDRLFDIEFSRPCRISGCGRRRPFSATEIQGIKSAKILIRAIYIYLLTSRH